MRSLQSRRRTLAGVVALLAAAMLLAACGDGDGEGTGAAASPSEQTGLASMTFTRFDGKEGSFADYRGRPLVVNFFASWCVPCVREMPEFEQVHALLGDRVAFLGLDVRDRLEDGQRLARQTGVTYDLARDPQGEILAAVGGAAMPTTAFLDAEGRLALVQSRAYDAAELQATIEEELLS